MTTAPESYDGFGSKTVAWLGTRNLPKGRDQFRRVAIPREHYEWQTARYHSGMYPAFTDLQYHELTESNLIGPLDTP